MAYTGQQPQNGGIVVQEDMFETGAVATGTTIIPRDNTIPQITEGDEYMSLAFTPTDANNWLYIDVTISVSPSTGSWINAALFKDAGANSLASMSQYQGTANAGESLNFSHRVLAGSTAAQTFSVRAGMYVAGTLTFNGEAGAASYGGTMASSIRIREVSPNKMLPSGNITVGKSQVRLHTGNGYGSTNNKIHRFLTSVEDVGSDITYADSATLGATFTANIAGIYSISFSCGFSSAADLALSLNSTQLTAAPSSVTPSDLLIMATLDVAGLAEAVSWTGWLGAGDVVRAHSDGIGVSAAREPHFTMVRIA